MFGTKCLIIALCLSLSLNGIAGATFSSASPGAGRFETAAASLISQGEVIESPADATSFISIGGVGQLLLASGAKVRLSALPGAQPLLAVSVISGDLIAKLHPQAGAFVQASGSTFVAARGAYFHASARDGAAVFDASESVAEKLGNWAIKAPAEIIGAAMAGAAVGRDQIKDQVKDRARERFGPARHSLSSGPRPIGAIESLGAVTINARQLGSGALLWGNELIRAPEGMSATATLDAFGQVTLAGGSQARLMAAPVSGSRRPVLAASLLAGSATFKPQSGASAYVEAGGSKFVSARGSRFRVMLVEGRAVIDAASDSVLELGEWRLDLPAIISQTGQAGQQAAPRRYIVRPVGLSSNLVVRARSVRQIQVRVTDENDRPVPDVPVIFLLNSSGGQSVGALGALASTTAKIFTDSTGIASVEFTAGATPTSGTISATVEGTNASWVGQISLLKVVPGFWSPQNVVPMAVMAGAAAVSVSAVKGATEDGKPPVTPSGGPVIKP
jgi:hypothetical protein